MYHVLIIATDARAAATLDRTLTDLGYRSSALSIEDVSGGLLDLPPPDVILLDSSGRKGAVRSACQALRDHPKTKSAPLILSIDEQEAPHIDFSLGFDDFILQPCPVYEIEARIRLSLWRLNRVDRDEVIKIDDLVMDLSRYEVQVRGIPIELTFKEYELLRHLALHRGRAFRRESLLNRIWGADYYGGIRTVDVHIRRLRAKLEGEVGPLIKTVRGVGYKLE